MLLITGRSVSAVEFPNLRQPEDLSARFGVSLTRRTIRNRTGVSTWPACPRTRAWV